MNNNVVKLTYPEPSIALVAMEDRERKNTFSYDLIKSLWLAFEEINDNTKVKVVVIHGYDNYFCSGGSKDELLTLAEGTETFADVPFYRLLLDCKVPVIAAMQGHSIGGGLIFGCYADILVMALESLYTTNFMKYGFTPGFGSTYIIPQKFGTNIARTMLLGAQNYQGIQLKEWGVPATFVKRAEVIMNALEMAKLIAEKPRESLLLLKQHLTQEDKELLPKFIEQEIAMHQITFTLPEVKIKIDELFGK